MKSSTSVLPHPRRSLATSLNYPFPLTHPVPFSQFHQRLHPSIHYRLMKRSHRFLQRRLDELLARPVSPSDRSGYLYNFFETSSEVKVGRSIDPARRQLQWDAECPNSNRWWDEPIWCLYANRAGKFLRMVRPSTHQQQSL